MRRRDLIIQCAYLITAITATSCVSGVLTWRFARNAFGVHKSDPGTTVYEPKGSPLRIKESHLVRDGVVLLWLVEGRVQESGETFVFSSQDADGDGIMEYKSVTVGPDSNWISQRNFTYTVFDDDGDRKMDRQVLKVPRRDGRPGQYYADDDGDGVFDNEWEDANE